MWGPGSLSMEHRGNLFDYEGWEITSDEDGLVEVGSIGMDVIRVAAVLQPSEAQGKGDGTLHRWRVTVGEMEVLLEVGRFHLDIGVEMTMI